MNEMEQNILQGFVDIRYHEAAAGWIILSLVLKNYPLNAVLHLTALEAFLDLCWMPWRSPP